MERKVKDKIIKDFDSIIKLALSNINNEYLRSDFVIRAFRKPIVHMKCNEISLYRVSLR